jgi:hypothetical protein
LGFRLLLAIEADQTAMLDMMNRLTGHLSAGR